MKKVKVKKKSQRNADEVLEQIAHVLAPAMGKISKILASALRACAYVAGTSIAVLFSMVGHAEGQKIVWRIVKITKEQK